MPALPIGQVGAILPPKPALPKDRKRILLVAAGSILLFIVAFILLSLWSPHFLVSNKLFRKVATTVAPQLLPAIEVNNQGISKKEYQQTLESQKYFYENLGALPEGLESIDKKVQEEFIQEVLLTDLLKKNGITVSDDEVRQRIWDVAVKTNYGGDWSRYENELKDKYHTTLVEVQSTARLDILKEKTAELSDKKHIFTIWIAKNEPQFASDETLPEDIKSQIDQANVPKKLKAEEALAEVNAGANFADLATSYSEDQKSAQNGGDLGLLAVSAPSNLDPTKNEGTFPGNAAVRLALRELDPNTSKLYETFTGYAIIKVTDFEAGPLGSKSFDEWYPSYRAQAKVVVLTK